MEQLNLFENDLAMKNELMREAILSVPEFIRYPWDWMQCIFCGGVREHGKGCVRAKIGAKKIEAADPDLRTAAPGAHE